ncbi:hypothetical protein A9Q99_04480 [Gammaproteobacteria bacterium 45_16_T64]|nr:hypothetical protein A9Q99_04480 [Gammaproteobacteria bacterium 45_16_T64]
MKWTNKLSLREKTILVAITCSLIALAISSTFNILHGQKIAQKNAEDKLTVISRLLSDSLPTSLDSLKNIALSRQRLSSLNADSTILAGCLYDAKNNKVAQYTAGLQQNIGCPKMPGKLGFSKTQHWLVFTQPILSNNLPIGSLLVASDIDTLQAHTILNLIVVSFISALSLAIAYVLAVRLQSFITDPLKSLQETANRVQLDNDYSHRAEKLSNDELGDLVDSFNGMLNKIEKDNSALQSSEERFRTLTAASPVGVFQTDNEGNHIYVNDRWREITGIFEFEITFNGWIKALHPEERFNVIRRWKETIKNAKEFKMEYRLLRESGETTTILCHAKPLTLNDECTGFLGSISDMSELKSAQSQLEQMALYDPLTKLSNRHLFRNRLEKAIKQSQRSHHKLALLFLDIDHFKRINDTLGHDQGDELLRAIAHRLRFCTRPTDTIARLGGDEFTILIPEMEQTQQADTIARKVLDVLKVPIRLVGQEVIISSSIGITIGPEGNEDASALMKNADLAMYKAKEAGRDNYQFFSADMNTVIREQLKIENELRLALQNDEFELYYQPKVKLDCNQVFGYEALIRWNHPKRGLVPPNDFISVAEDTGLIIPIGEWVIKNACENIERFISYGLLPKDGHIAINLSARQFHESNLVSHVRDMIVSSNINPANLELEITESLIMDNVQNAIATLNQLRELGTYLAIDDFGTGYSSLSYLKQLPIQILKVDRSFVMDIPHDKDDMEITAAVIAMAHKLGLKVVAEGVEDNAQLEFLKQNKCDYIQGYLFGKPTPISELINTEMDNAATSNSKTSMHNQ